MLFAQMTYGSADRSPPLHPLDALRVFTAACQEKPASPHSLLLRNKLLGISIIYRDLRSPLLVIAYKPFQGGVKRWEGGKRISADYPRRFLEECTTLLETPIQGTVTVPFTIVLGLVADGAAPQVSFVREGTTCYVHYTALPGPESLRNLA